MLSCQPKSTTTVTLHFDRKLTEPLNKKKTKHASVKIVGQGAWSVKGRRTGQEDSYGESDFILRPRGARLLFDLIRRFVSLPRCSSSPSPERGRRFSHIGGCFRWARRERGIESRGGNISRVSSHLSGRANGNDGFRTGSRFEGGLGGHLHDLSEWLQRKRRVRGRIRRKRRNNHG